MKIKGRQIDIDAGFSGEVLRLAGITPTLLGQLINLAQDIQLTLVEVDNSTNNGVMSVAAPAAGTVYRAIYPVPHINLGPLEEGTTVWFEFCYGHSGDSGNTPFISSATQDIYWMRMLSSVTPNILAEGAYYQIEISNKFGRVYASMAKTQLLAPTPQPQAAEEDGEEVTPTPQSQEEVEPEEVEDPGDE